FTRRRCAACAAHNNLSESRPSTSPESAASRSDETPARHPPRPGNDSWVSITQRAQGGQFPRSWVDATIGCVSAVRRRFCQFRPCFADTHTASVVHPAVLIRGRDDRWLAGRGQRIVRRRGNELQGRSGPSL